MSLPRWLDCLRREYILDVVHGDTRTNGDHLLGVHRRRVFAEVIGGGQASFDEAWRDPTSATVRLTGPDRSLLYAYFNMKGHLLELVAAFEMLLERATKLEHAIVLDLGCGPGTGCLALAHAYGADADFEYIGVDRAASMLDVGQALTSAAKRYGYLMGGKRTWAQSLADIEWPRAPGWRPVIVIASYLLASPTLDADELVSEVLGFIERVGRGPALVLYTNSPRPDANAKFPAFRGALLAEGFELLFDNDDGRVADGSRTRSLRYALFIRQARQTLDLGAV